VSTLKASFATKIYFNTVAGSEVTDIALQAHKAGYTMFQHNGSVYSTTFFLLVKRMKEDWEAAKLFKLNDLMDYYEGL
jgi:hypothetical protein